MQDVYIISSGNLVDLPNPTTTLVDPVTTAEESIALGFRVSGLGSLIAPIFGA